MRVRPAQRDQGGDGSTQRRFVGLDGLRGLAALLVATMHGEAILGVRAFDHAYLMVDLFFLMSGFVLSAGYADRLTAGDRGLWFMRARAIRLYPLAITGLLLGLAVNAVIAGRGHPAAETRPVLMFALAAAFVPWLGGGLLVPLNGPVWSLQVEYWTNVAYGFLARRLTDQRLALAVAAFAAALALIVSSNGVVDGGFANNDPGRHAGTWSFLIGWARIGFSFPLGVLLHRWWRRRRPGSASQLPRPILIPAILIGVSLCPTAPWTGLDLAFVCLGFPALLLWAAGSTPVGMAERACVALGRLSYGLYTVHAPILLLALALRPADAALGQKILLFVGAMGLSILVAIAAERWLDTPARRGGAAPSLRASPRAGGPEPTASLGADGAAREPPKQRPLVMPPSRRGLGRRSAE